MSSASSLFSNVSTRLLPTALACGAIAACGLARAQSSVTLYGIVSVDAVHATHAPNGANKLEGGKLNSPRLGFKGSEDLGGGLTAIFDLESGFNPDTGVANGGSAFFNRGSFVGFTGRYGALTFGRQWNVNDDLLYNFFVFGGYGVFVYRGFDYVSDLVNNSVKYASPSVGGFTFEALGGMGEGGPRTYELAGAYTGGGLKAALTYHETNSISTHAKDKLYSAGLGYKVAPQWDARVGYSRSDALFSGTGIAGAPKAAAYDVGVDFAVTPVTIVSLDYVARDVKNSSADSHFIRLLARYNLSKRTQVSVNVVQMKNNNGASESFFGLDKAGATQNIYSLGLSHSF